MIHAQDMKIVDLVLPQSIATNGTATGYVDTKGFDYCTIIVKGDTAANATNKLHTTGILLSEGDTTSSYATITGQVAGTDYTVPTPSTSVANFHEFGIDLRGRKRYLKISLTPLGAARIFSADALLSRAEEMPVGTTERGTRVSHFA